jgi:hypothetical protein
MRWSVVGRGQLLRALAVAGLGLIPGTTHGQLQLDVAPLVGGYASFTSFTSPPDPFLFGRTTDLSQGTGVALGGQVTVWPGSGLGLRAYAATSASSVGPTNRDIVTRDAVSARVTLAGAELVLPISTLESGTTIYLAGGAGMIRRSGDAYEGHEGTTDLTGTGGVGSRLPIADRLSLQLDARVAVYRLALSDDTGAMYGAATQADILAQVGLVWRLGDQDDW